MTHLKPRTASVLIYDGDDFERLAELAQAVRVARERLATATDRASDQEKLAGNERDGDDPPATEGLKADAQAAHDEAQEAYDQYVQEAAERAFEVRLRSIGRRRFRDLVAEHPTRTVTRKVQLEDGGVDQVEEDHEDDYLGVNAETFPAALLSYIDPDDTEIRTIIGPEFKGGKAIEAFLDDEVDDGDFDRLWMAAYSLNRAPGADPKAAASSRSTS